MSQEKKPVIEVRGLEKKFILFEENVDFVLKGIDFEVFFGEFVIIFGPSGCGKSTLLNTILGLEPPTKGTIRIRDKDIYSLPPNDLTTLRRQKIGMVYQQFNWVKSLNVVENVALPLNIDGHSSRSALIRAYHLLSIFKLEKFAAYHPHQLSGGQQQRVATARALSLNPWLIMADEPTGNLDTNAGTELMSLFKKLNEKSKRTIILVTHNFDYEKYATKVIFMENGKFVDVINKKKVILTEKESTEDILKQTGGKNAALFYS